MNSVHAQLLSSIDNPLPLSLAAITGFSLSPSCDMALASYSLLSIRDRSSYKQHAELEVCLRVRVDCYLATRGIHACADG